MDNNNCPDIEVLFELADLFKVFGDSTHGAEHHFSSAARAAAE